MGWNFELFPSANNMQQTLIYLIFRHGHIVCFWKLSMWSWLLSLIVFIKRHFRICRLKASCLRAGVHPSLDSTAVARWKWEPDTQFEDMKNLKMSRVKSLSGTCSPDASVWQISKSHKAIWWAKCLFMQLVLHAGCIWFNPIYRF